MLILVVFFSFSGGYVIRGLVHMASERYRGGNDD